MIKTNPNIDYGSALSTLFERLKVAEAVVQGDEVGKYANGYGRISMAVKMCLIECTDLTFDEIHKKTRVSPAPAEKEKDDLPDNLFTNH